MHKGTIKKINMQEKIQKKYNKNLFSRKRKGV